MLWREEKQWKKDFKYHAFGKLRPPNSTARFFCVSVDDTAELPSVPPFFVTIRPALLGYPSWQASCYM